MMTRQLTAALLTALTAVGCPVVAQTPIRPETVEQLKQHIRPITNPAQVLACPDLAAQGINFTLLSRTNAFQGRVRITGVIRNQGTTAYLSNANQQMVYLYEQNPGGQPRLLAQQPFQNLGLGQEVRVVFERNWHRSSPAEGEFPPSYIVEVGYDPDIRIDNNPHNDDCRLDNNRLERSGSAINALF
ncbi:MAG: hypothetical protein RMK91_01235 [Pseudanabaenaceae cyanobacterium SKYGB_i_bin29]|nr:hypothetical protein [Pseudanabaenaceae cyanobacterium SKYG29]MDW8420472.1 hypothetical protein [Pseudanabaenaceae cyanobacterium SKYGB_i_bin29]